VNITSTLLMELVAAYIWPFARLTSMLMTMLVIGSQSVPIMVRMFYTIMLTAVIAPVLPKMPSIELLSITGFMITAQQVLIGVAMGFVSQMLIQAFIMAGQIISMQTSLGFASMVDPLNGESTPVIGQFYLMLGTLLFFALDGHLTMIQMISQSFITLPVGTEGLAIGSMRSIVDFVSVLFQTAVSFSLSATIALLLINFSFGVMTRAAPQLNIFSMGFAVTMICGLFIMWASLSGFMDHFVLHWQRTQNLMCDVLALSCREP
jgi:flagellar biosynthetic protein FliR